MALVECRECKADVSEDAWRCPSCGAKLRLGARSAMYNALWVVGILVVLVAGVVFKSHPIVLDRLNGGYPWAFDDRGVHKALSRRASSMVDDFSYSGLPARVEREPGGYYAVHRYRVVAGDGEVRDYYVSAHLDINYKVKSVGEPVEGKIY